MRDNRWLAVRLEHIRLVYFPEVPVKNTILVRFGRISKTRFGSIIAKPRKGYVQPVSLITVNGLFKDEQVPDYVIDATLGHEFVHYAHGFHSPLQQQYDHPHRGDVVNKELRQRGMGETLAKQLAWTKSRYRDFLRGHGLL